MQFYSEYEQKDVRKVEELIANQSTALLVTQNQDSGPRLGIFNPVRTESGFLLHLHRADEQVADLRVNPETLLVFQEILATIPSHWVDAQDGSMATQYYRYAEFTAVAKIYDEPGTMITALKAMLERFQPEGGYAPLTPMNPLYKPSLRTIVVVELTVTGMRTKWKLGQNKTSEIRRHIVEQLKERGAEKDHATVQAILA